MQSLQDMEAQQILQKFWGYRDFRSGQLEVIDAILNKKHVLAILTTGGGKSICFQVPGLILPGVVLVISPLISLMIDQIQKLRGLGIAAFAYNSNLTTADKDKLYEQLFAGNVKFLYLAPESLHNQKLLKLINNSELAAIIVDEAHCISTWGHDFRPSYLQIRGVLSDLVDWRYIPVACFTATATPRVQAHIVKQMGLIDPVKFVNSFARAKLSLGTQKIVNGQEFSAITKDRLEKGPVLVYSSTRKDVESLSGLLSQQGITSAFYHGGLDAERRQKTQQRYINNEIQVVCATNAFGMGVDKPDIRTVIHAQIPDSLENFYQEAGRAGRDGENCENILNLSWRGIETRWQMLDNSHFSLKLLNEVYNYLLQDNYSSQLSIKRVLLEIEGINLLKLKVILRVLIDSKILRITDPPETDLNKIIPHQSLCIEVLQPNVLRLGKRVGYANLSKRYKVKKQQLQKMIEYTLTDRCRMRFILNYFGENTDEICGICDNCRPP